MRISISLHASSPKDFGEILESLANDVKNLIPEKNGKSIAPLYYKNTVVGVLTVDTSK